LAALDDILPFPDLALPFVPLDSIAVVAVTLLLTSFTTSRVAMR
jgi:hypothetical protein